MTRRHQCRLWARGPPCRQSGREAYRETTVIMMIRMQTTMTATDTIKIPHGDKLSPEGEWGYAHVDAEDLWDTINLLRYYLHTIEPHGGDSDGDEDGHPTPKYRLMAATMRIAARLATDAADHLDDDDGAQCRERLAEIADDEARYAKNAAVRAAAEQAEQNAAMLHA